MTFISSSVRPFIPDVQAPVSMRAMCQAMWLLTVTFGDVIVIVVAESSFFESRVSIWNRISMHVFMQHGHKYT